MTPDPTSTAPASVASRALEHVRALWPRHAWVAPAPFLTWSTIQAMRGSLRWEHVAMPLAAIVLAYWNARTKRLLIGVYPVALVGVLYDAMAVVKKTFHLVSSHIHVCDLHAAEVALFGVPTSAGRVSVPEWLQGHTAAWADVLCAIPYATFVYSVMAFGAYLYFRSYDAMRMLGWAFLLMNLAGFITYHVYPAAPPWYVATHGCAVDLSALPSAGPALTRVDGMIGFPFFANMYARAATPFGAMPSLHVAYPMTMVVTGWRAVGARGRALLVGFYLWMCVSAAYLDHHWVLDMLLGTTYALTAGLLVRALFARRVRAGAIGEAAEVSR
jgi:hypothetical protein